MAANAESVGGVVCCAPTVEAAQASTASQANRATDSLRVRGRWPTMLLTARQQAPLARSPLARDSLRCSIIRHTTAERITVINEELLEETQAKLEGIDHDEEQSGMDRRHFVFFSLVAAAAATLGVEPAHAERLGGAAARAGSRFPAQEP